MIVDILTILFVVLGFVLILWMVGDGAATSFMALIGLIEVKKRLKPVDWSV